MGTRGDSGASPALLIPRRGAVPMETGEKLRAPRELLEMIPVIISGRVLAGAGSHTGSGSGQPTCPTRHGALRGARTQPGSAASRARHPPGTPCTSPGIPCIPLPAPRIPTAPPRAAPGAAVLVTCIPRSPGVQSSQIGKLFLLLLPWQRDVQHSPCSQSFQLGILPHNFLFQGLGPSGKRGHPARQSGLGGKRDLEGWGAKPDLPCTVSFTPGDTQTLLARFVTGLGTSCCAPGSGTWEMDPRTGKSFSLSPEVVSAINTPQHGLAVSPCPCGPGLPLSIVPALAMLLTEPDCHLSWAGLASPGQEAFPS